MSRRPARAGVTRLPARSLDPLQLVELTRFVADEVAHARYPVDFDEDERWHQRIYRDPSVDLWLISWLPSQGTRLHDHGGSAGAFSVVSGQLTEVVVGGAGVRERAHARGASSGFGAHHVHDVRNAGRDPAVSVHAYSPPLTTMTFYDLTAAGLVPVASLATEDPEPDFAAERAAS